MRIPYTGEWGKYEIRKHLTVEYVLSTVHIGRDKNKLSYIKPVREVLDLDDLSFDHLLQRDLDDSRTSEEIINSYLANSDNNLPLFFPPLTIALLPSSEEGVGKFYPERRVEENEEILEWHFGSAFSVEFFVAPDGSRESEVALEINPSLTHQLAIDGQHRLMALKASSLGRDSITDIHKPLYEGTKDVDLTNTSVPVCFLYFPELTFGKDETRDLIKTSRRVFLDVNKNAREPARSREILLDDYDLINHFVSKTFSTIKERDGNLKLYHTEYDTPSKREKMTRPLGIVDVLNMKDIISYVLMSKSDIVDNIGSKNRRPADNSSMRGELEIKDRIPSTFFNDFGLSRSNLTKDNLPKPVTQKISSECFEPFWQNVIIHAFENFYPFSVHISSVSSLRDDKYGGDTSVEQKLARAMLFEGQGLWWIVKSKADSDQVTDESAVSEAVDTAQEWVQEFQNRRAREYLSQDEVSEEEVDSVNSLYDLYTSKAFQIGLFMSISLLKKRSKKGLDELENIAPEFIDEVNHNFKYRHGTIRKTIFNKSVEKSLRNSYKARRLSKTDWTFLRSVLLTLI